MFQLDERLALCAEFVREGTRLADVGTDHAYLPVWLALNGKIASAVASDVRVGPLENAKCNIARYGVDSVVSTVLSDGLDSIPPDSAQDIVMAGMGGELMVGIMMRTQWLRDGEKRLILQPMTRADSLRLFLCENGFCIEEERACLSGHKSYSVMVCRYDGRKRSCDDVFRYIGLLEQDASEEARQYIRMVNGKLKKKLNSFAKGSDDYARWEAVTAKLDRLAKEVD